MNPPVAVLEHASEQQEREDAPCQSSRFLYPEFTGPGGERYLKKLLRQILPMALYRTWEIFTDHQAKGNECYLSIPQLATLAGRSLRTMQKNVASLQAKHLLVERAARKVFRGPDGSTTSRLVIVKDFAALYALVHEYHEWLHAEGTIPPDRAFRVLLSQDASLVAKLRRFDNYRRLLYNHVPGPGPCEREEDRWFTEYRPGADVIEGADQQSRSQALPPILAAKKTSKESPKRNDESSHRDEREEDSCDSASSCSEEPLRKAVAGACAFSDQAGSLQHNEQTTRAVEALQPVPQSLSQRQQHAPATQNRANTRGETRPPVPMAQPALDRIFLSSQHTQAPGSSSAPSPLLDHPLARSFLYEIAAPFGDRNPKGSLTRVLRIIASASLEEADVVLCLVRAYTIARDTRTLRAEHAAQESGQANRMPLFCTLFERFVQTCIQHGTWTYSWHQMENDLAADTHLTHWWGAHSIPADPVQKGGQKRSGPLHLSTVPSQALFAERPAPPVSGSAARSAVAQPIIQQPDPYEVYINALLAKYSAPEAYQETE